MSQIAETTKIPTDLQSLYNYLRIDAYGMKHGKTQQELASKFGINVRTIQARLTALVTDHFKCICTTAAAGVYIYPRPARKPMLVSNRSTLASSRSESGARHWRTPPSTHSAHRSFLS